MFLERLRALLSLGGDAVRPRLRALLEPEGTAELPAGCSVELELEAKELLARLFQVSGADEVERAYRELCLERGADESPRRGPPRASCSGWATCRAGCASGTAAGSSSCVANGASRRTRSARSTSRPRFLRELETTRDDEVLQDGDARGAARAATPCSRGCRSTSSRAVARHAPTLAGALRRCLEELRVDALDDVSRARWIAYWSRTRSLRGRAGEAPRAWFRLDDDRFRLDLDIAAELAAPLHGSPASSSTIDSRSTVSVGAGSADDAKASSARSCGTSAIRSSSCRARDRATIPEGETDVRLAGRRGLAVSLREGVLQRRAPAGHVAQPAPGPPAGMVRSARRTAGHRVRGPVSRQRRTGCGSSRFRPRSSTSRVAGKIVAYPDLRAAAGHVGRDGRAPGRRARVAADRRGRSGPVRGARVRDVDGRRQAAAARRRLGRDAAGAQHAGERGRGPRRARPGRGRCARRRLPDQAAEARGSRWRLASDNPAGPDVRRRPTRWCRSRGSSARFAPRSSRRHRGRSATRPSWRGSSGSRSSRRARIATGATCSSSSISGGAGRAGSRAVHRRDRPAGETAFVLARRDDGALAVPRGRPPDRRPWHVVAAGGRLRDVAGVGRGARGVAPVARRRARQGPGRRPRRCSRDRRPSAGSSAASDVRRILGSAPGGGLRIDGGDDGFAERTVSLIDLAWVIVAADDVASGGGLLDEARVNSSGTSTARRRNRRAGSTPAGRSPPGKRSTAGPSSRARGLPGNRRFGDLDP